MNEAEFKTRMLLLGVTYVVYRPITARRDDRMAWRFFTDVPHKPWNAFYTTYTTAGAPLDFDGQFIRICDIFATTGGKP